MATDDDPWRPARPTGVERPWEARAGSPEPGTSRGGRLAGRGPGSVAGSAGAPDRPGATRPDDAGRGADADLDLDADARGDLDAAAPPRPSWREGPLGRLAGRAGRTWRAAPPGRRIAVAATALVVATALVASVGLAARPDYPVLVRPSATVDDLRTEPTETLWELDLAAAFGVEPDSACLGFDPVARLGDDVLVTTTSRSYGVDSDCEGGAGRLLRLDARTGEVRWRTDVATSLGVDATSTQVATASDTSLGALLTGFGGADSSGDTGEGTEGDDSTGGPAGEALVSLPGEYGRSSGGLARIDLATGAIAEQLDAATLADDGELLESVGQSPTAAAVSIVDAGRYGPDGSFSSRPADVTTLSLYRADDLRTPAWTGRGANGGQSWLVGDLLVVQLFDDVEDGVAETFGTRPDWSVIDARTGEVTPLPGDMTSIDFTQAFTGGALVSGSHLVDGRPTSQLLALDDAGGLRWQRDVPESTYPTLGSGCVVVDGTGQGDGAGQGDAADGDAADSDGADGDGGGGDGGSGGGDATSSGGDTSTGALTCVDPLTGDDRWTRQLPWPGSDDGSSGGGSPTATRQFQVSSATGADVVFAARATNSFESLPDDATGSVAALDPATGRTRFETELPVTSYVIASSRTTGYSVSFYYSSGAGPTIQAFDLDDGRALWRSSIGSDLSSSPFWGPTLVQVGDDGVVRGRTDGVRVAD